MTSVRYQKDANNIGHLILDKPGASANLMDEPFTPDYAAAIKHLLADDVIGVIIRSEKKTFFAGGDLEMLSKIEPEKASQLFDMVEATKAAMRTIETCGKPVVVCINGAAMGGGWEICLSAHHRIALSKGVMLGLPEVTLGLLPGGGGVTRMVRLLGLQGAMPYLTEGKSFNPQKGMELGLIHQLADSAEEMIEKATAWILANPESAQPWDQKGYKIPGGTPSSPKVAGMLAATSAILKKQTKGVLPAPESILCTMVEGAQVDFDTASRIESRYFAELVSGKIAKNMINTFWFQLNEIKAGGGRPNGIAPRKFEKVGILGAGMMGAGIAWACASRGIPCVLKDVSTEAAEKGKSYSAKLMDKQVAKGHATEEEKAGLLSLIMATASAEELKGCDLVIEAVFENRELKAKVTQEAEAQLAGNFIFASNTSTLPISGLAEASACPENFVGLHFFSPVDKMPLVEIIVGDKTSDQTLANAYDFVLQIAKTPIVANDFPGFYTSRVFGTFTAEGQAMVGEGVHPASIENASWLNGFPVGPLAVSDEISLTLMNNIRLQNLKDAEIYGQGLVRYPNEAVMEKMLKLNRPGKAYGCGFYDYPENAKKKLWEGLELAFPHNLEQIPLRDIKDRLLFVMPLEAVRCFEEKVINSVPEANVGSIFGIGYPAWTGGVLQFINYYGVAEFVERTNELAEKYGERFAAPKMLLEMASKGESF